MDNIDNSIQQLLQEMEYRYNVVSCEYIKRENTSKIIITTSTFSIAEDLIDVIGKHIRKRLEEILHETIVLSFEIKGTSKKPYIEYEFII